MAVRSEERRTVLWSDDVDYPVVLGSSFNDTPPDGLGSVSTFRYDFFPTLVDTEKSGWIEQHEDNMIKVHREQKGIEVPAQFNGQFAQAAKTEFALIFDGTKFILEKVHSTIQNLRPIRQENSTTTKRKRSHHLSEKNKASRSTLSKSSSAPLGTVTSSRQDNYCLPNNSASASHLPENEEVALAEVVPQTVAVAQPPPPNVNRNNALGDVQEDPRDR